MFLQVSSHSPNQVQPWKDDRCLYVFVTADICSICVVRQTFLLVLAVIKEEKNENDKEIQCDSLLFLFFFFACCAQ